MTSYFINMEKRLSLEIFTKELKKNAYRDSVISDDIFFSCTTWTRLESLKIIAELLTCKFLMSNLTFR